MFVANMKVISLVRSVLAGACAALVATRVAAADSPREHFLLDLNWEFHYYVGQSD
jgi:hypothetical protein